MQDIPFQAFPKIARLSHPVLVTEKIDGTNAQVYIGEDGSIRAGSRNRWVQVGDDNYGFAAWVEANKDELIELGPGHHYGEWWGRGIQRNYSLPEKRFSLFNIGRWGEIRPPCCHVVPLLAELPELNVFAIRKVLQELMENGSRASPGFMNPEGVVVFHSHGNHLYKMTPDDQPKEAQDAA